MEKINLNKLYEEAVATRLAAERTRAEIFVEKGIVPELVKAAKNGESRKVFCVPYSLAIALVLEIIEEKVEGTKIKQNQRELIFSWD